MPKASLGFVYKNKLPVANAAAFYALGPVFLNSPLSEKIEITKSTKVSEIQLLLATYARTNRGELTITLSRMGETLATKDFDLSTLTDNSYISWKFKSQEFEIGQQLDVLISSNANDANNAIAVYATKIKSAQTRGVTLAGAPVEGSIIMNILGEN